MTKKLLLIGTASTIMASFAGRPAAGPFLSPASGYQEVKSWPALPKGLELGEVPGVDVDSHGHVFIFHRPGRGFEPGATELLKDAAIVEVDGATGKFIAKWGANTFLVPHGITIDQHDNLWLTDVGLQQIFKYSHDGRQLLAIGEPRKGGWDATHFNQPTDVMVRADGSFYVSDGYVNSRVALFDAKGTFVREWGKKGSGESQFSNPHDLAFAPNGDVIVADRENSRIQFFDRQGRFKSQWLGAKSRGRVFAVATDASGAMYVGVRKADYDPPSNGVLKLDREWNTIGVIGFGAAGDPVFNAVHDIAVGRDGSIYVAETRTKRVVKLKPR
jgi:peptidylamidoglycolate lyase